MADTQAPPAPPQPVYIPVPAPAPAVTAGWTVPAGRQAEPKEPRAKRGRGIPAAPALAAAGNATALSVTSAYAAGGWPGMAAAGGAAVLAAGGAVARRRRTVKRSADTRKALRAAGLGGRGAAAGWTGSGRPGSGPGSRGGSGSRRTGSGSAGSGAGSGGGRTSGSPRGSAGRTSPSRTSSPNRTAGSPKPGGAGSPSRLGRALDRMLGGSGKKGGADKGSRKGSDKANRKSAPEPGSPAAIKAARKAAKAAAREARKTIQQKLGIPSRGSRMASASKRGASRAWSKTASPRAAARRLTARSARKVRALTADGLRSLRAGAWGLIRHRSWKKGAKRALAAWTAHRAKRKTTTPAAPAAPTIAATVRRPASSTPTRTPGGTGMSGGHHFVAPAMEGARAAANYSPTGMVQVIEDFAGLSQALELHAEAMRTTVERAHAEFPLAPQVIELMRQVHGLQLKAAELASELQPASRKLHETDLARHESPRNGERMWDITAN